MGFDKRHFIDQLALRLKESNDVARRAGDEAREAARTLQTESEKKEDGRAAIEFGSLATGQAARSRKAQEELSQLAAFVKAGVPRFAPQSAIGLGAVVDISVDDGERGSEERTFIILPVGAGTELTGPGGDGFLSVITPASPVGRSLLGRRAGDVVDVTIAGETREWTVVEVC